jgi:hypothetical protein
MISQNASFCTPGVANTMTKVWLVDAADSRWTTKTDKGRPLWLSRRALRPTVTPRSSTQQNLWMTTAVTLESLRRRCNEGQYLEWRTGTGMRKNGAQLGYHMPSGFPDAYRSIDDGASQSAALHDDHHPDHPESRKTAPNMCTQVLRSRRAQPSYMALDR